MPDGNHSGEFPDRLNITIESRYTIAMDTIEQKHVIGYLRVSTDEQACSGLGLEAQRTVIAQTAAHRNWSVTWATDDGYTASNLNRPALTESLLALR